MTIQYPGQKTQGESTKNIVELVDIYPTLCELTGLPLPPGLERESLVPILKDAQCDWDSVAISQWPRPNMGYSMRTDTHRITIWESPKTRNERPSGVELYDHRVDPGENINIANYPETRN